jgi:hypothetical protein
MRTWNRALAFGFVVVVLIPIGFLGFRTLSNILNYQIAFAAIVVLAIAAFSMGIIPLRQVCVVPV